MRPGETKRPAGDLREACIREAELIIAQSGIESLSLREVARRIGVSHQAPYRHFPSRDHILAEVVRRAFGEFAEALRAPPHTEDATADLLALGMAYVTFALARPLQYRLIFGGALPDPEQHPEMLHGARDAYAVLRTGLGRVFGMDQDGRDRDPIDMEAMFVWSSLHGLVSLMRTDALETVQLSAETRQGFPLHALRRVGVALGISQYPFPGQDSPKRHDYE
ncbi:TetR/AcrR family transcriptional regulator [Sphingomonas lacunae]|uniref:TetR/AcrR family transcriptional regulator n=1 Tax=Sphingomonas lacunae TaxID=2698828 RepID=A0A6M4AVI7_9SPHN|nr:TetR/AcrR family transcriptional regulator [Sphingomonas lacunae]QJQ33138.1 TetR/AcrR family transcriptional regulator [Sphingomonas lacunae]